MRKEIYQKVKAALEGIPGSPVKHVDLWNQNVAYIEQEEAWPRPAAFVEFEPIEWAGQKSDGYRTNAYLRLHIVTDWNGQESSLEVFDLCETVRDALIELSGDSFLGLKLARSYTNHNHEDIVESIEVFSYGGEWMPDQS